MKDSNNSTSPGLVTVEQLAEVLRVPASWVYSRTRTAGLTGFPVLKCGKYCRFEVDAVLAWLRVQNPDGRENAANSMK